MQNSFNNQVRPKEVQTKVLKQLAKIHFWDWSIDKPNYFLHNNSIIQRLIDGHTNQYL